MMKVLKCIITSLICLALSMQAQQAKANYVHTYYLYVWAGPKNHTSEDFVATFSMDINFVNVNFKSITGVGSSNNEPHHMYLDSTGKNAFVGGLLSFVNPGNQPDTYFFNLNLGVDPSHPQLLSAKSDHVGIASATDAGLALSNGGFLVTMMGGVGGGAGGSLVEYDSTFTRIAASYQPTDGTVSTFNPHGISTSQYPGDDFLITTDYVLPTSTVGGPIQFWSTVRIWKFSTRTFLKTINLSGGTTDLGGIMDVAFLKNDRGAIASAVGTAQLYYINPISYTSTLVYSFPTNSKPHILLHSKTRNRLFVSCYGSNTVYLFDTRRPTVLRLVTSVTLGAGPHFMYLDPKEKYLVVSYYFLDESFISGGLVVQPGDDFIRIFRLDRNLNRLTHVPSCDIDMSQSPFQANPHGLVVIQV